MVMLSSDYLPIFSCYLPFGARKPLLHNELGKEPKHGKFNGPHEASNHTPAIATGLFWESTDARPKPVVVHPQIVVRWFSRIIRLLL